MVRTRLRDQEIRAHGDVYALTARWLVMPRLEKAGRAA
jgi:hypothetical protein